jgi:hypothetical protein
MRTDLNFTEPVDIDDTFVCDADLIGFRRPRDIVHDPLLTLARKRQLLAYWASDIHAVIGCPALRSYAYGPTVSIDDIKAALCELDEMVDLPAIGAASSSGVAA